MDVVTILQVAQLIAIVVLGFFIKSYLPSYFQEKGKNLATKEDIAEITDKVEAIRTQYAKQSHAQNLIFAKEFDIYKEVWSSLIELRRATIGLRPVMDYIDTSETEEQRKTKRLKAFSDSNLSFGNAVEKNQPFYPKEIYDSLRAIALIANEEAFEFSSHNPDVRPMRKDYWESAMNHQERILSAIDVTQELIRSRVTT